MATKATPAKTVATKTVAAKTAPKKATVPAAPEAPANPKLPASFKMPKTLAACADLLYTTQQARYAVNKQVEAFEAIEGALKNRIIDELPKSEATGIAGKTARVYVENKVVVKVVDFAAYVLDVAARMKKDPGAVSLLQKRVGETAVKEVWESGKTLKGIESMDIPVVRMNKV